MAVQMTGLGSGDYAEIVDCLLLGAAVCAETSPQLCAYRQRLADQIGDALDTLPDRRRTETVPAAVPTAA
ncbi:hypothetical protein ACFV27_00630 [Streptomyces antimycoticus]|uniref:hypothetical protein n=1 Tax=Streptomyces antimycoticus TaxID=68175 RepID=UPI003684156F